MPTARAHQVDPSVTRSYHWITRCARRAFLLGEGPGGRKERVEHVKAQGRTDRTEIVSISD
jgi:hypothetical protein